MTTSIKRREFLQLTATATAFGLAGPNLVTLAAGPGPATTKLVSPGCRRSKVKVARLYMGNPQGHWPKPELDLDAEIRSYQAAFDALKDELADVEFVVDQLVTSPRAGRRRSRTR